MPAAAKTAEAKLRHRGLSRPLPATEASRRSVGMRPRRPCGLLLTLLATLGLLAGLLRAGDDAGAAAASSSSPLAFDTIILADQAAAFATHALGAVDFVVKRGGRARLELAAGE